MEKKTPSPATGERRPRWKGDAALPNSKRDRARRLYPLGDCEDCGQPAVDRHHKDGDPGNNAPENIACLCRRCHMKADGRLSAMSDVARKRWEKRPSSDAPHHGAEVQPHCTEQEAA